MLKFEHVTKVYGGKKALNDLTLSFLPGHVYALVGPNGSGKSTLPICALSHSIMII